jgi:cytochrome c-type biogenesis protein CcmE
VTTTEAPPSPVPAPRRPRKLRTRYIVAIGGCVAAIVAIVVLAVVLSENVVYFRTVTEAVHARSSTGTSRFRIAGAVVPGTITETKTGVRFRITDGKHTVTVDHSGDPPDLFKAGAPVVCEGHWAKADAASAPFESDRILIRHGADYTPPKVDTNKASKADVQRFGTG